LVVEIAITHIRHTSSSRTPVDRLTDYTHYHIIERHRLVKDTFTLKAWENIFFRRQVTFFSENRMHQVKCTDSLVKYKETTGCKCTTR